ncbi:MAG: hypothetical protein AB1512_08005 [Thermodesulfobacteriota bacterium]
MLDLRGIERVMEKLRDKNAPGELEYSPEGRSEIRYSYYLNGKMMFTFGLTRGSKAKSKSYYYVPRQMKVNNRGYKDLHDCPWKKFDYNKHLIESMTV